MAMLEISQYTCPNKMLTSERWVGAVPLRRELRSVDHILDLLDGFDMRYNDAPSARIDSPCNPLMGVRRDTNDRDGLPSTVRAHGLNLHTTQFSLIAHIHTR